MPDEYIFYTDIIHRMFSSEENKDKIHSVGIHCSVQDIMKAQHVLGLDKSFHFHMEPRLGKPNQRICKTSFLDWYYDPKWNGNTTT